MPGRRGGDAARDEGALGRRVERRQVGIEKAAVGAHEALIRHRPERARGAGAVARKPRHHRQCDRPEPGDVGGERAGLRRGIGEGQRPAGIGRRAARSGVEAGDRALAVGALERPGEGDHHRQVGRRGWRRRRGWGRRNCRRHLVEIAGLAVRHGVEAGALNRVEAQSSLQVPGIELRRLRQPRRRRLNAGREIAGNRLGDSARCDRRLARHPRNAAGPAGPPVELRQQLRHRAGRRRVGRRGRRPGRRNGNRIAGPRHGLRIPVVPVTVKPSP